MLSGHTAQSSSQLQQGPCRGPWRKGWGKWGHTGHMAGFPRAALCVQTCSCWGRAGGLSEPREGSGRPGVRMDFISPKARCPVGKPGFESSRRLGTGLLTGELAGKTSGGTQAPGVLLKRKLSANPVCRQHSHHMMVAGLAHQGTLPPCPSASSLWPKRGRDSMELCRPSWRSAQLTSCPVLVIYGG